VAAWRSANPDRLQEIRLADRKVCAVYAGYCKECGAAFVSRRERAYCSDSCERRVWHRAHYVSQAPEFRLCACCGKQFAAPKAKTRPTDFCSAKCKSQQERRQNRAHRIKRKAAARAVTVESVDPIKVFERDRWRCRLCGVKTPKAQRGTYASTAPELDHIIPLSKGGEHSYRNTQCACRRCNGAKADRPLGQLLLIG
jgi:5-methylcytosine-specific restriction endonuclease McrA